MIGCKSAIAGSSLSVIFNSRLFEKAPPLYIFSVFLFLGLLVHRPETGRQEEIPFRVL